MELLQLSPEVLNSLFENSLFENSLFESSPRKVGVGVGVGVGKTPPSASMNLTQTLLCNI